ncbi:MAG: TetR/AcrR family transcriptional regulator C-terminal domain-containing protein [Lachnospiraceae bacterium]|nr:TetR/AcrR family transcriptional regulator C-terminal domain-containing protein [Lachnospiraceae bacterium]
MAGKAAEKENRRSRMTKQLLRRALLELMQEKPLSKITIREICEQADLNRTTFYLHYTDQTDLLKDIERDVLEQTKTAMQHIHTDLHTTDLVSAFLAYVRENDLAFRILFGRTDSERFRRAFVTELRQVMAPDLPEYGSETETGYVLTFMMYGSLYIIIEWMNNGYRESVEKTAELLFRLCDSIDPGIGRM